MYSFDFCAAEGLADEETDEGEVTPPDVEVMIATPDVEVVGRAEENDDDDALPDDRVSAANERAMKNTSTAETAQTEVLTKIVLKKFFLFISVSATGYRVSYHGH